jgi:hypothetical protein
MQRLPNADDSQRFSFGSDQADFRGVDLFVDAMRLLQCDGLAPFFDKKLSRATSRGDFLLKPPDQHLKGHLSEILTAACTHGNQVGCHFLIAYDDLIRQPVQAMFPYFIGYFLVPQIAFGPEARGA